MPLERLEVLQISQDQVAIALSQGAFGEGHIGIAFRPSGQSPKVLHLAWHRRTCLHAIPNELEACWVGQVLPVPPLAGKAVVGIVQAVAAKLAPINFGINFIAAAESFDAHGAYKPPPGSDGLTCATYVLEVLRAGRVDLVDLSTWPETEENKIWGEAVCSRLADPNHAAAVRRNASGLRLRPIELGGAARLGHSRWPVAFTDVQQPAADVQTELSGLCPGFSKLTTLIRDSLEQRPRRFYQFGIHPPSS